MLENVALSVIVPVARSTVLSTKVSSPLPSNRPVAGSSASTTSVPAFWRRRISGSSRSGTAKVR